MKIPKLKRQYIRKFSLLKIFLVLKNHILNIQIDMMVDLSHITILKKFLKRQQLYLSKIYSFVSLNCFQYKVTSCNLRGTWAQRLVQNNKLALYKISKKIKKSKH